MTSALVPSTDCPFPNGLTCIYLEPNYVLNFTYEVSQKTEKAYVLRPVNSQTPAKKLSKVIGVGGLALVYTKEDKVKKKNVVKSIFLDPSVILETDEISRFIFLRDKSDGYLLSKELKIKRFAGEEYNHLAAMFKA